MATFGNIASLDLVTLVANLLKNVSLALTGLPLYLEKPGVLIKKPEIFNNFSMFRRKILV